MVKVILALVTLLLATAAALALSQDDIDRAVQEAERLRIEQELLKAAAAAEAGAASPTDSASATPSPSSTAPAAPSPSGSAASGTAARTTPSAPAVRSPDDTSATPPFVLATPTGTGTIELPPPPTLPIRPTASKSGRSASAPTKSAATLATPSKSGPAAAASSTAADPVKPPAAATSSSTASGAMSTAAGTAAARPTSSDSAGAASSEVRPPLPPPPELSAADQARLAEALADNPIVTHVPPGADLAVQVRVGRVVKSDMWARASAPDVGLTRSLTSLVPLPIDFEKDVAVALLIFECEAGVSPSSPQLHGALALETLRPLALADLLPPTAHAVHMAGLGADAYPLEGGLYVASPSPRLILIATDLPYLVRIAKPHAWQGTEDLLTAGEVAFAARPSAALKEMIRGDAAAMQAKNLKAGITGADLARFALDYNLIRLALETESVAGSIDLMREADAGHMEVRFASKSMALFATALAQALTDPLAMGLPALMGGTPLEEAPAEPLYRVRPVGDKVLVTMSRKAATALVERLCDTARQTAGRRASADHLRTLGAAIRTYVTVHQAYPKTWSDLVGPGLVHEMALFENPALKNHPPAGDYELVPMTKESAARRSWDKVLAYEAPSPEPPAQEALNVLFADGHVEYMDMAKFQQLYRMTIESLGH